MSRAFLLLSLVVLPDAALAATPVISEAQRAQMETLRAEIAAQVQLQAFDLLDELVYGWTQQPVFAVETPVVLADVGSPVGFGSGLEALIENHFAGLIIANPRSNVVLAHCPQCTATVVHSGAKGTVVSRGVDAPEALSAMGALSRSKHALFLDFEAEGSALVLRARITSLEPALPIIYAKTLTTSTSTPALLRTGDHLKSAAEARQEYVDALQGRGLVLVPVRLAIRSYAEPPNRSALSVPPYVWLQLGAELALTQARAWTAGFSVGGTWMPQLYTGWLAQARFSRLLTGSTSSLTRPDVYGFVGGSVISIHGQGARMFQQRVPTQEDFLNDLDNDDFHSTFAAFQLGVELRVKHRIGASVFLETLPSLYDAEGIGRYVDFILPFQSFGAEVSFCF